MPPAPDHKKEKVRFWLEVGGFAITIFSVWLVAYQIYQQRSEARLQTILTVEDSERFINELSLNKPELGYLLANAEGILKMNEEMRKDFEYRLTEDDKTLLLSMMPVSAVIDYHEARTTLDGAAEQKTLKAVARQLQARVQTYGFILLQEWEKMYRMCEQGVLEEEFWRGPNAYEAMIGKMVALPAVKMITDDPSTMIGFHPDFREYISLFTRDDGELYERVDEFCDFSGQRWRSSPLSAHFVPR